MDMTIETEFQTNLITLRFESSQRWINLTKEETREFNERMQRVKDEN